MAVAATAILTVLMIGTIFRNQVWANELRLFSDVVAKSPHKLRAYENLVFAYMKRGEEDKAVAVAKSGLDNIPEHRVSLLDTIGNLYLRQGRAEDAVRYFKQSNDESRQLGAPSRSHRRTVARSKGRASGKGFIRLLHPSNSPIISRPSSEPR